MPTRVGVVLSGCGVYDGSEIHEAVLTLLALDRADAEAVVCAPDKDQMHVVDHRTGEPSKRQKRNVLTESARIARGEIVDVASVKAADLDAVILPGGYGAAKNLSTFAVDGDGCTADPDVAKLLVDMHAAGKPIGALCIAPTVLAKVLGGGIEVTIGNDADTAAAIEAMGGRHFDAGVTDVVVDPENRIVTTPCYMLENRIRDVATGAEKAVQALLQLVRESTATPA